MENAHKPLSFSLSRLGYAGRKLVIRCSKRRKEYSHPEGKGCPQILSEVGFSLLSAAGGEGAEGADITSLHLVGEGWVGGGVSFRLRASLCGGG